MKSALPTKTSPLEDPLNSEEKAVNSVVVPPSTSPQEVNPLNSEEKAGTSVMETIHSTPPSTDQLDSPLNTPEVEEGKAGPS